MFHGQGRVSDAMARTRYWELIRYPGNPKAALLRFGEARQMCLSRADV
jgi:hypothetical protein